LLLRQGQEQKAREVIGEAFSISRFKADGLALNAVYRASGSSAQAFEQQIKAFTDNLSKVSAAKAVEIEVALEFQPTAVPSGASPASARTPFEQAYEMLRASGSVSPQAATRTFKRKFTLPATDAQKRAEQIKNLADGLREAVATAKENEQVSLSMQGRTADYNSAYALGENRNSAPKAVYDPRIVGNDMGLWVMGRHWLKFVDEATEELQEFAPHCPAGNTCDLLAGLSGLARGNGALAAQFFRTAAAKNPQDELSELGLGTAAVIAGNDEEALSHYRRAAQLAPANKTAKRNIAVLTDEK